MTDAEISQRIAGAGFVYDLGTGRYAAEGDSDEPLDYVTEEIADELAIPVADLLRWEETQQARDSRHD
jgi:hypothetical protein